MSTSHDGRGAGGSRATTRGIVVSIFTRRQLNTLGDTVVTGTRDLNRWLAESVGRIRYLIHRRPLLGFAVALALGFSAGLFLRRRVGRGRWR